MEKLLTIIVGTLPLGAIVVIFGLLNRQAIIHLNQRIERIEEGFNNHLSYHLKGKGFYDADHSLNYGLPPKNSRRKGGDNP